MVKLGRNSYGDGVNARVRLTHGPVCDFRHVLACRATDQ
jgi:hypothetical protein